MKTHLRAAFVLVALFTALTGLVYPLGVTALAQFAFPLAANGSLVQRDGVPVGSRLIGQGFAGAGYLHPRPSAVSYDGATSSGTNLGPTSAKLADRLAADAAVLRTEGLAGPIPADALTASGSGLDPHISPNWALAQAPRIAAARGVSEDVVRQVISAHIEGRSFGLIGEPRVNVLLANLALDREAGK
ncbi:MAG TPA: potassium-transporting ATPase subunit KdpC [Xanthobacteraceae bacterium]|nr:potassium-transporting ATPase subunit KdpC [Xanthobacteraceae bacterium]